MEDEPILGNTPLHEELSKFLSQNRQMKSGKFYKKSYVYNPKGYHFIDLHHYEAEGIAPVTVIEIDETNSVYKVKVTYGYSSKYETVLGGIQEVVEFIDNFSWRKYPEIIKE